MTILFQNTTSGVVQIEAIQPKWAGLANFDNDI